MDKKVIVNVKYTDKEISSALVEYINCVLHSWVILPCVGIFIIGVLFAGLKSGFSSYINILLLIFIIVFILAVYYFYLRPIRGYQKIYQNRAEAVFEFSVEVIRITRDLSQSICKWDLFPMVYETKRYISLIDQNKAITFVPKKYFESDDELRYLQDILISTKKDKYRKLSR